MFPLLPLLLVAAPQAPPSVALPAEVPARPGRVVRIPAETTGHAVRWVLASDDADLIPLADDGKVALFCSPVPGRFVVFAWTAAGDAPSEAARCVVVVAEPPAPPPPDALTGDLRRLFAADPTPDKSAHLAQLAAVYREAVRFVESADVRTAGELAGRIRAAAATLVPPNALVSVRQRVAEEIARHLTDDGDRPLDAVTRRQAAELFSRIATSLEAVR